MDNANGARLFERLERAGFRVPDPERVPDLYREWFNALQHYAAADVEAGIDRIIRDKRETFWPTIGAVREAIHAATAGRETTPHCATCGGSTWVEARPYRANGGYIYQGVTRCPDCGVPPPTQHGPSRQTPLSDPELREWRAAQRPVPAITSMAEVGERLRQLRYAKTMPADLSSDAPLSRSGGPGTTNGGSPEVRVGPRLVRSPTGL
jgi:hypothetical protein